MLMLLLMVVRWIRAVIHSSTCYSGNQSQSLGPTIFRKNAREPGDPLSRSQQHGTGIWCQPTNGCSIPGRLTLCSGHFLEARSQGGAQAVPGVCE